MVVVVVVVVDFDGDGDLEVDATVDGQIILVSLATPPSSSGWPLRGCVLGVCLVETRN